MAGDDVEPGRPPRTSPEDDFDRDGRGFELHSVVVSYEDGREVCTVYPRGVAPVERVDEWFSADRSAFVDLDEIR